MKSVMQHQFSQVPKVQIQRSSFNRSSGCKMTMESGLLIPFSVMKSSPVIRSTSELPVLLVCLLRFTQ